MNSAYERMICTPMFIAAQVTIAMILNQCPSMSINGCPSMDDWIKIEGGIYVHIID